MTPIWKDYLVTIGNSGPYDFRIVKTDDNSNDETIFQGRAYARPGETAVKVRINDVVADCLARKIDIIKPLLDSGGPGDLEYIMPFKFVTEYYDTGTNAWVTKDTQVFIEDWSYDASRVMGTSPMAAPINGRIDPRQYLLFTDYSFGSKTLKRIKPNGTTSNQTVSMKDSYSNAFELDVITQGGGNVMTTISTLYPTYAKLQIGTTVWTFVEPCNRYVLYYKNAFGGWDSFLIEGPADVSDAQSRFVHAHEYNNADRTARGKEVTVNELTRQYTLRTGWLTDEESARMHHLLNSTDVYLHDLVDDKIDPVVLTGSETQYKTFRGEGRKFVSYTITAQLAQERIRR